MKLNRKQLWTSLFMILLVNTTMVTMIPMINVTAASPETHFYVDPPEVKDVMPPTGKFKINISIADAPPTYAWEFYISWNATLLELAYKKEGDFLHRGGAYTTTFYNYPSFDEANLNGEIMFGCSLYGDVPEEEWASGDGWLCTLGFVVKAEGSGVINLFDTRLWDYFLAGSPSHTYYPNLDGFFYNEPFHNIAITNVTAYPTVVEVNEPATINVTITNEGNYSETSETFNVTVYTDTIVYEYVYDPLGKPIKTTIVIGDEITVGTQTVTEPLAPGENTTLTFTWDTIGVEAPDTYTISAEAMGDDDTRDNTFIDGTVALKGHNLNITDVTALTPKVYEGWLATINVTVANEGNYSETFDVAVYADIDTAVIGDEITVGSETSITLDVGATTTLTFNWDTTGAELNATYTISAYVPPVVDEVRTADNTLIDGTVHVKIPGDVNGDGMVDASDLSDLSEAYGSRVGDTKWNPDCDFNGDDTVDVLDIFDLSKNYG